MVKLRILIQNIARVSTLLCITVLEIWLNSLLAGWLTEMILVYVCAL